MSEFIASFMRSCISTGVNTPNDMCSSAEKRIKEIENELRKIEVLRLEQNNLRTVIRQLSGKTEQTVQPIDIFASDDKLTNDNRIVCESICNKIEEEKTLTARQLTEYIGYESQNIVYSLIKILAENKIIKRQENNKSVFYIIGENWNTREKFTKQR
jgi:hypothetical protein